ncbi:MAG TPA: hypothetical protein VGK67_09030 [Myxococcales bacterium]|jgi:hypothetical protein
MRLALCLPLTLAAGACAHGPQPLAWTPVERPTLSAASAERAAFLGEQLRFEVADQRDEGQVAFRDGEREIATPDDIAAFYAGHFIQALASHGLRVVEHGESLVVRLSVRRALGTRGDGSWGIKNHVGDFLVLLGSRRPPEPSFARAGEVQGSSLRVGTGSSGDYSQAMAGAVLDAARRLLEDPDLLRLLMNPEAAAAAPQPTEPSRRPVAPAVKGE